MNAKKMIAAALAAAMLAAAALPAGALPAPYLTPDTTVAQMRANEGIAGSFPGTAVAVRRLDPAPVHWADRGRRGSGAEPHHRQL